MRRSKAQSLSLKQEKPSSHSFPIYHDAVPVSQTTATPSRLSLLLLSGTEMEQNDCQALEQKVVNLFPVSREFAVATIHSLETLVLDQFERTNSENHKGVGMKEI